jgi:ABC-type lipoprotein release transport system permease subunit
MMDCAAQLWDWSSGWLEEWPPLKMMRDLLYGVQPLDASVSAAVAMILLGVASAVCLAPAWRVSRLDPTVALPRE